MEITSQIRISKHLRYCGTSVANVIVQACWQCKLFCNFKVWRQQKRWNYFYIALLLSIPAGDSTYIILILLTESSQKQFAMILSVMASPHLIGNISSFKYFIFLQWIFILLNNRENGVYFPEGSTFFYSCLTDFLTFLQIGTPLKMSIHITVLVNRLPLWKKS